MNTAFLSPTEYAFNQNASCFDDFFRDCTFDNYNDFNTFPSITSHDLDQKLYDFKDTQIESQSPKKIQNIDFQDPVLDFEEFSDQFLSYTQPKIEPENQLKQQSFFPCTKKMKVEENNEVYAVPVTQTPTATTASPNNFGFSGFSEKNEMPSPRNRSGANAIGFEMLNNVNTVEKEMPKFSLIVGKQPAEGVVYKRILKPSPAIMLLEGNTFMKTNRLFIDVVLVRDDNGKKVDILEGNHPLPVCNGQYTIFKKLKIKETSRVHKTKFRLKFRLVKCTDQDYIPVPNCFAFSDPISVYSHSSYVTKKKKSDSIRPPTVIETLPSRCPVSGNTRLVIIGSNFLNSPKLTVKFGSQKVTPTFHESGTLVLTTPVFSCVGPCRISVSNDGEKFTVTDSWLHVE